MVAQKVIVQFCLATILIGWTQGQQQQNQRGDDDASRRIATTPIPILRQINMHNEDGSYTYGYESGDGSYKIETKGVNGEVRGKYGYYDDQGQLREIEYGANKMGFIPTGSGIETPNPQQQPQPQAQPIPAYTNSIPQSQFQYSNNIPKSQIQYSNNIPQSQIQHSPNDNFLNFNQHQFQQPQSYSSAQEVEDDGQYRPQEHEAPYAYQPEVHEQQQLNHIQHQQQSFGFPQQRSQSKQRRQLRRRQQQQYFPTAPLPAYTQQQQQPQSYVAESRIGNVFQGHPASNINLISGTYSIVY